jgi:hypothetical protein
VAALVRWLVRGRKRRHIARLRALAGIGLLGGLVHVLELLAVVALPLLPALLLMHADRLWLALVASPRVVCRRRPGAARAVVHPPRQPAAPGPPSQRGGVGTYRLASVMLLGGAVVRPCLAAREPVAAHARSCLATGPLMTPTPHPYPQALAVVGALQQLDAQSQPPPVGHLTRPEHGRALGLGAASAGLASMLRPLYAALCRRAIRRRCSREALAKTVALPPALGSGGGGGGGGAHHGRPDPSPPTPAARAAQLTPQPRSTDPHEPPLRVRRAPVRGLRSRAARAAGAPAPPSGLRVRGAGGGGAAAGCAGLGGEGRPLGARGWGGRGGRWVGAGPCRRPC